MNRTVKKILPVALIAVLAAAALYSLDSGNMHVNIDGDEMDGPLGALIGVLFAGGGLLLAGVILTGVAVFLGMLFAGLGVLMVTAMALVALLVAAAVSPLLLPLLIPVGLYWYLTARSRKQRLRATMEHAV